MTKSKDIDDRDEFDWAITGILCAQSEYIDDLQGCLTSLHSAQDRLGRLVTTVRVLLELGN